MSDKKVEMAASIGMGLIIAIIGGYLGISNGNLHVAGMFVLFGIIYTGVTLGMIHRSKP